MGNKPSTQEYPIQYTPYNKGNRDNKMYLIKGTLENKAYINSLYDPRSFTENPRKEYPVENQEDVYMKFRLIPKGSRRLKDPKWELVRPTLDRPHWKWIGTGPPDRYGSYVKYVCGSESAINYQYAMTDIYCDTFEGPVNSEGKIPFTAQKELDDAIESERIRKEKNAIDAEESRKKFKNMQKKYQAEDDMKKKQKRYSICLEEFGGDFAKVPETTGGKRRTNKNKKTRRQKKK